MERLFSGTSVLVARRRLKMLACLLLGIFILASVITGGYFAYKKNQGSSEPATANAMQKNYKLVNCPKTSPPSHLSVATHTASLVRVESITMSDIASRSPETLNDVTLSPNQTTPTNLQSTEQTNLSTIDSSNQHVSTTLSVTLSSSRETNLTDLPSILTEVTTPTPIQSTSIDMKTTTTPTPIQSLSTAMKTTKIPTPIQTTSTDLKTTTKTPTPIQNTSTDLTTTTIKLLTTEKSAITSTSAPQVCSPTSPDYCECVSGGMWTVIQRRFDGSVDFYRTWTEYKEGFGDENGEFWLGNEALHQMTSSANYMLKLNLTNWENITKYAVYDTFRVADEADGYRLTIGGYCGDAGDSMTDHNNGQMFSTKDRDNDMWDNHCAQVRQGGWWYRFCGDANLNGVYYYDNNNVRAWGINWYKWPNFEGNSLQETTMMIKEVP